MSNWYCVNFIYTVNTGIFLIFCYFFIILNRQDIPCPDCLARYVYPWALLFIWHIVHLFLFYFFSFCILLLYNPSHMKLLKKSLPKVQFHTHHVLFHQTVPSLPNTQRKEASSSSKAFAIGSQTTSYLIVPVALPSLHFASAQNELFVASQTVPILFLLQFTLPGCLWSPDHLPFETLPILQCLSPLLLFQGGFYAGFSYSQNNRFFKCMYLSKKTHIFYLVLGINCYRE